MRLIMGFSAVALLAAACDGNFYKTVKLDPEPAGPGTSIVSDARSRLISNVQVGSASRPGQVDPIRIICVEPSPDVAVAVANSIGAAVGVSQYGSGALSTATAEGLAQIAERTTAIQAVLRQGYQACIDYMNGAINGTTYSLRQSRLDDLLVTLVLAEDAAGAFGRKGAAISTTSSASAEAAAAILPDISKGLDQATNDLSTKQQDLDTKEAALAAAQENANQNPGDAQAQTDLDKAQRERDAAKAARDAAMRSVTGLTEAASKATAGATAVGQGGITAQPDPEIARAIGAMQETFVNKDVEQAYLSTCLVELGQWKQRDPEDDALRQQALNDAAAGLDDTTLNHYFLATTLGQRTWLTDHCQANFDTFLRRAQENRYNLNVMKMQIEAERVKLQQLTTRNASLVIGEGTNVRFERNAVDDTHGALGASSKKLREAKVPLAGPGADQTRLDLLTELSNRQTTLLGDAEQLESQFTQLPGVSAVEAIEKRRNDLAGDLRQHSGPAERASWETDYELVQAEASQLAQRYSSYSQRAKALTRSINQLLTDIQGATP